METHTQSETKMRFVVAAVRPAPVQGDHAEFDDFHQAIVKRLEGDEFGSFWATIVSDAIECDRAAVQPQPQPKSTTSRRAELIHLFAALCVT